MSLKYNKIGDGTFLVGPSGPAGFHAVKEFLRDDSGRNKVLALRTQLEKP